MGSQCSSRNSGVIWSRRRVPVISRAVAFWTDCNLRSRVSGRHHWMRLVESYWSGMTESTPAQCPTCGGQSGVAAMRCHGRHNRMPPTSQEGQAEWPVSCQRQLVCPTRHVAWPFLLNASSGRLTGSAAISRWLRGIRSTDWPQLVKSPWSEHQVWDRTVVRHVSYIQARLLQQRRHDHVLLWLEWCRVSFCSVENYRDNDTTRYDANIAIFDTIRYILRTQTIILIKLYYDFHFLEFAHGNHK